MSQLSKDIQAHHIFPKVYGEYHIDFSAEDEALFAKYTNPSFIAENSKISDGIDGPLKSFSEFFQILYLEQNLVKLNPAFVNIKNCITDAVWHYTTEVLGLAPPEGCEFDISDSWFIKLTGGELAPHLFQQHNHSFAFLSGVLYLEDSDNGLYFTSNEFHNNLWPFVWQTQENVFNTDKIYIKPARGKLVLFSAKMDHALAASTNENDTRHSLVVNIFPRGIVSTNHAAMLDLR